MLSEALQGLAVVSGGLWIDGTLGGGGHSEAILTASAPDGRLLGLDADPAALERVDQRLGEFGNRVVLVQSNFRHLEQVATAHGFTQVDGVLLDLGLSSFQLGEAERGFSFNAEGPLDMRFDPTQGESAVDWVNHEDEQVLADQIYRYGEEPKSRRIAAAIVAARPLRSTRELAAVVERSVGRHGRIHPATQTFQALRIAVNGELDALETVLPQAVTLLKPRGRLAVITFHSLEDRIVKLFMRREAEDCICPPALDGLPIPPHPCTCGHQATLKLIHRKALAPAEDEVARNPRSRSAKLRVAEKLAET